MLTALSIRDVVLIEALDLEFGGRLGVLTGETGAGKSILLDALGLALGARGDSALVRSGAAQAVVTASFDFGTNSAVHAILAESGITGEAGEPLVIRRIVKADGGSRGFINDQPASVGLLRDIGAIAVELHGQQDDRGLLDARGHRLLLDAYAIGDMSRVSEAWRDWRAAKEALEVAEAEQTEADRDREWLEHAVGELNRLAAQEGEEADLAERRAAMQRGERIAGDLQAASDVVDGSEGALVRLRQAARILDRVSGDHEALGEALAAVDRALIEAEQAHDKVSEAAAALTFDPAQLEADETRLFELRGVARKHRVTVDDLPRLAAELAGKLERLTNGAAGITTLSVRAARTREAYLKAAQALHEIRKDAAKRLDAAVAQELAPLKLDAARFRTIVETLPEPQWSANGSDRVNFEIATNPGAPFGPLARIASGGELSRFILALKVALATQGAASTMIFDEIDRGVGGAVASAIGERLARLAHTAQVLVVTHSPQVAARGNQHLLITKAHDGSVTRTSVVPLDDVARREEIARMLSGAVVTDEARAQAERLLETA